MSIDVNDNNRVEATFVECPTCHAWVGWACEGPDYGYHAAGYHPSRERAAKRAHDSAQVDLRSISRGKE